MSSPSLSSSLFYTTCGILLERIYSDRKLEGFSGLSITVKGSLHSLCESVLAPKVATLLMKY